MLSDGLNRGLKTGHYREEVRSGGRGFSPRMKYLPAKAAQYRSMPRLRTIVRMDQPFLALLLNAWARTSDGADAGGGQGETDKNDQDPEKSDHDKHAVLSPRFSVNSV
jgi:hypothetical protein